MALVNRDKDVSEQRDNNTESFTATATGVTLGVFSVPYPATLDGVRVAGHGLSGAPTLDFAVLRFIVGTGVTTITAGFTTLTVTEFSTSGLQSVVTVASGNTLLNLLAGDIITATTGGSNTAAKGYELSVITKAAQDIKTTFGV